MPERIVYGKGSHTPTTPGGPWWIGLTAEEFRAKRAAHVFKGRFAHAIANPSYAPTEHVQRSYKRNPRFEDAPPTTPPAFPRLP